MANVENPFPEDPSLMQPSSGPDSVMRDDNENPENPAESKNETSKDAAQQAGEMSDQTAAKGDKYATEENRRMFEIATREGITNNNVDALVNVIQKLTDSGDRQATIDIVHNTLQGLVAEGGEQSKAAQEALDRIQSIKPTPVSDSEYITMEEDDAPTEQKVAKNSETLDEIAARRNAFNKASNLLEQQLNADLKSAQAEMDQMVQTGKYDPNMSFDKQIAARKDYEQRKAGEAENDLNDKARISKEKVQAIASDDKKMQDFLGLSPKKDYSKMDSTLTDVLGKDTEKDLKIASSTPSINDENKIRDILGLKDEPERKGMVTGDIRRILTPEAIASYKNEKSAQPISQDIDSEKKEKSDEGVSNAKIDRSAKDNAMNTEMASVKLSKNNTDKLKIVKTDDPLEGLS